MGPPPHSPPPLAPGRGERVALSRQGAGCAALRLLPAPLPRACIGGVVGVKGRASPSPGLPVSSRASLRSARCGPRQQPLRP